MRRVCLIAGLMAALGLTVFAVSAAVATSFAGTWSLDKAKSQGLSQRLEAAESVVWTITQDDKTISIDQKVTGGQPPAGGGPGGGGGGRGPGGPTAYKLDGSETTSDITGGQMTGKSTTKATWAGSALELSRNSLLNGPNGEVKASETRKLSLSADGKVLTAVIHSESPRGTNDSTLVFNKQ